MFIRPQRGSAATAISIESIKTMTATTAIDRSSGNSPVRDLIERRLLRPGSFFGGLVGSERSTFFATASVVFVTAGSAVRDFVERSRVRLLPINDESMVASVRAFAFRATTFVPGVTSARAVKVFEPSLISGFFAMAISAKHLALAKLSQALGFRHPERIAAFGRGIDMIAVKILRRWTFYTTTTLLSEPFSANSGVV